MGIAYLNCLSALPACGAVQGSGRSSVNQMGGFQDLTHALASRGGVEPGPKPSSRQVKTVATMTRFSLFRRTENKPKTSPAYKTGWPFLDRQSAIYVFPPSLEYWSVPTAAASRRWRNCSRSTLPTWLVARSVPRLGDLLLGRQRLESSPEP